MSIYIPMMNTLKHIRKNIFSVTQSEFAQIAGVTQATVSRWESDDDTATPSLTEMSRIRGVARERGVSWDDTWFFSAPVTTDKSMSLTDRCMAMEKDSFNVAVHFRKLRERTGISLDGLAHLMGYARASSIQRYEDPDSFNKMYFSVDLTERIANALLGKGEPAIEYDEVWALALPDVREKLLSGASHTNAKVLGSVDFPKDKRIPVYGQAVGGLNDEFEFNGNVLFDVLCPPQLSHIAGAYAIQVSGESMWPRYRDGEIVYVDPTRRVKKDDFVVAQIASDECSDIPQAFVKMFCKHNTEELVLEQFNPAKKLVFPHSRVKTVHFIALSGEGFYNEP